MSVSCLLTFVLAECLAELWTKVIVEHSLTTAGVANLVFADDLVILVEYLEALVQALNVLHKEAKPSETPGNGVRQHW